MERLPQELLREIMLLQEMGAEEIARRYPSIVGRDAGGRRPEVLRRAVAYRLQELHYGVSLSEADVARLGELAGRREEHVKGAGKTPRLEGTRLVRAWKGVEHEVTLRGDGKVEYAGAVYASLSAVARRITGTRWNGRKFFGVA